MTPKQAVEKWLFDPENIRSLDDSIVVTTSCLYPSMSSVVVNVEGGALNLIVHDGGRAIIEASGSGARFKQPTSIIAPVARNFGLTVEASGVIRSPRLKPEELGAGILMVANASRDASFTLLSRYRPLVARDTKELVRQIIYRRFAEPRIHRDLTISGASQKLHKLDYVIDLENGRQLAIDVVRPDASSINAAVVAGLDIASKGDERIVQRAVYDDQLPWKNADLALLSVASRPVQLSALPAAIDRLAVAR